MKSREVSFSQKEGDARNFESEGGASGCPRCGNSNLVEDNGAGETVCASCGFVIGDGNLANPFKRNSPDRDEETGELVGVGPPETSTLHDKGLPTEVSPKDKDGRGNSLSAKEAALARKLRKWQKRCRVSGSGERNLATALREIDRMGSQLGVPENAKERASRLYKEAADQGLVKGRSIEGVSSAALYAACRGCQLPRTMDEIFALVDVEEEKSRQAYRVLSENLDLDLPPLSAVRYVRRFGDKLNLSRKTQSEAIGVLRKADEEDLISGRSPSTTAVAGLYIAASLTEEKVTQKKARNTIDVPQQTVSERYRQIAGELGIDVKFQSWMLAPIKHEGSSQQEKENIEDRFGQTSLEGFGDNGALWWIPVLLDKESKLQQKTENDKDATERDEQEELEKFGRCNSSSSV